MTALVSELGEVVGVSRACTALGVARPSYYRRSRPAPRRVTPRPPPPRALSQCEQQDVVEVLHSERFVDQAPVQVVAALLEQGVYHCSARTMYRILSARGEVRERRNQLRHPRYRRPELLASPARRRSSSWCVSPSNGSGQSAWRYADVRMFKGDYRKWRSTEVWKSLKSVSADVLGG